jgi:penicillin-binding protein 2
MPLAQAVPLLERQAGLPGLQIDQTFVRVYPYGRVTAHLTGYVRRIGPTALDDYLEDGYERDDLVGATGLEKTQETHLRGEKGVQIEHRDAMGRLLTARVQRNSVPGSRVVLSIDIDLQTSATALLQDRPGAIVAVDPRNGDVLALASYPGYDANQPVIFKGSGDSFLNKAAQEHYAPGSTFKLVTATAWLLAGRSPNKTVTCAGALEVAPGFTLQCNAQWGHGTVDMRQALMVSCNVYFYQLAKELREEQIYSAADLFGFGRPTGIAVLERGESPGVLGRPESDASRLLANRVMMGIGQGQLISVTPLQLTMAYSTLANGGTLLEPRLVLRVQTPEGKETLNPPIERGTVPWAEWQRQVLLDGFRAVVEQPRGTAHKIQFDPAMRVAGKTGTAQRHTSPDAWFVAFAPWDNPEICVTVLLEKAGHGGEEAAPVAKALLEEYFRLKGKRTTPPESRRVAIGTPKSAGSKSLAKETQDRAGQASADTEAEPVF